MSASPLSPKSGPATQAPLEVMPPERPFGGSSFGTGAGNGPVSPQHEALSKLIAYLMDNVLKVPGTGARIGINPILDLIPGIGDAGATVIQALTIVEAARRKVPKIVLARMALNVLLNGAMGVIPGVGEIFAFWFRPSSRNYNLLLKHAPQDAPAGTQPRKNTAGEWVFVIGLLIAVLVIMGFFIALGWYVLAAVWHAIAYHPH